MKANWVIADFFLTHDWAIIKAPKKKKHFLLSRKLTSTPKCLAAFWWCIRCRSVHIIAENGMRETKLLLRIGGILAEFEKWVGIIESNVNMLGTKLINAASGWREFADDVCCRDINETHPNALRSIMRALSTPCHRRESVTPTKSVIFCLLRKISCRFSFNLIWFLFAKNGTLAGDIIFVVYCFFLFFSSLSLSDFEMRNYSKPYRLVVSWRNMKTAPEWLWIIILTCNCLFCFLLKWKLCTF